jgi:hypothetical protein
MRDELLNETIFYDLDPARAALADGPDLIGIRGGEIVTMRVADERRQTRAPGVTAVIDGRTLRRDSICFWASVGKRQRRHGPPDTFP